MKAVQETIRIYKEKDVLRDYLEKEEVAAVMYTLADQEREFSKALRREREEGEERGEKRGEIRGEIRGAIKLYNDEMDLSPSQIIDKIMTRFDLDRADAEKYVKETLGLQLV